MKGKLNAHLHEIDVEANKTLETIMSASLPKEVLTNTSKQPIPSYGYKK